MSSSVLGGQLFRVLTNSRRRYCAQTHNGSKSVQREEHGIMLSIVYLSVSSLFVAMQAIFGGSDGKVICRPSPPPGFTSVRPEKHNKSRTPLPSPKPRVQITKETLRHSSANNRPHSFNSNGTLQYKPRRRANGPSLAYVQ